MVPQQNPVLYNTMQFSPKSTYTQWPKNQNKFLDPPEIQKTMFKSQQNWASSNPTQMY
jgi:hypothetical protein